MANIRTLKLNLLADVSGFEKGIKKASGKSDSFAKNLGRNFAIAGAAIGGAAVAIGVDAVKSAMADQKSQALLAKQLKQTTKASKAQVAQTEKWITAQQFAYGVADSDLRPALAKLVRVTGDVNRSQKLLGLAMDISAGAGVSLETATNAVAKAQQGQFKGLKSLGVPLSDAIVKNKDLAGALKAAEDRFNGAAKAGAETFAGKLSIFKQRMDEAKESIGTAILDGLQPLAEKWLPKIASGVTTFVDTMTGNGGYNEAVQNGTTYAYDLAENAKKFFKLLNDNKELIKTVGTYVASIFIGAKAGAAVSAMVSALSLLRGAFFKTATAAATAAGAEAAATGGASLLAALPAITAIGVTFGLPALINMWSNKAPSTFNADYQNYVNNGGPVTVTRYGPNDQPNVPVVRDPKYKTRVYNGTTYTWDPVKKKWYSRDISGGYDYSVQPPGGAPRNFMSRNSARGGGTTVINLNGIVDGESARRTIERVLQKSSIQSGRINLEGSAI